MLLGCTRAVIGALAGCMTLGLAQLVADGTRIPVPIQFVFGFSPDRVPPPMFFGGGGGMHLEGFGPGFGHGFGLARAVHSNFPYMVRDRHTTMVCAF